MRHLFSLLIKAVLTIFLLFIILGGFFGVSFADIFLIGIVLSALGYVGDVWILPRVGNVVATIADFGFALIVIWSMGFFLFDWDVPILSSTIFSSLVIALGEWFFHKYMKNTIQEREAIP
ncbi:DUF2512 family protein [Desmospora profundinema]|uniref:Membrane protein implicated in regulation of membrane protease activity n=1 Tax=Desmospora profundinema TaxID=1571184 RepID=A0ABU1IMG3_9BACL|nr:DUF2512 family protein [Desmospora profundinema]MDR6225149.1 membrane protein implicated in regulation of membrane protease activity [Desmospora profundinema]